jgi:hypothetical protein
MFALMMSLCDISGDVGIGLGAAMTRGFGVNKRNFDGLPLLVVISSLFFLLPLLVLGWVPDHDAPSVLVAEPAAAAESKAAGEGAGVEAGAKAGTREEEREEEGPEACPTLRT